MNYNFKEEILKLNNFTQSEILTAGSVKYFLTDIPEAIQGNIIPTMKMLQKLRDYTGQPIILNCTYRNKQHNDKIHGAKNSLHLLFNAVDFTTFNKTLLPAMYNILSYWDNARYFDFMTKSGSCGLGMYSGRFIHLDTRALLGYNAPARWNG